MEVVVVYPDLGSMVKGPCSYKHKWDLHYYEVLPVTVGSRACHDAMTHHMPSGPHTECVGYILCT